MDLRRSWRGGRSGRDSVLVKERADLGRRRRRTDGTDDGSRGAVAAPLAVGALHQEPRHSLAREERVNFRDLFQDCPLYE